MGTTIFQWCTNNTMLSSFCCPHLLYICVNADHLSSPESSLWLLWLVFTSLAANANMAISKLATYMENSHRHSAVIVLGDFPHTIQSTKLHNHKQHPEGSARKVRPRHAAPHSEIQSET